MNWSVWLHDPWVLGIGTGIIATVVGGLILYKLTNKKEDVKPLAIETKQENHQAQNVTVNLAPAEKSTYQFPQPENGQASASEVASFKRELKILFIDDKSLDVKIKNLKDYGWEKITQIFNANNIVCDEIREADIIFVDYKNIAKNEEHEGLAVVAALRKQYGDEKWLILFTAHKVPVNAFDFGANAYLPKNSTPYLIEQKLIEAGARLRHK